MNKKNVLWGTACFIIIIGIIIFLEIPKMKEFYIKSEIKEARYCEIDSDCLDAGGKCPFGCYVYVNKNEVEKIAHLIQTYDSRCVYGCMSDVNVICENKMCKEIFKK